jgi:uncharacterized protein YndB with AHSA1/START domain/DNA-binding transcriptional ArsR family regulator
MDNIFKALSDTHRRSILDILHAKDGLSLMDIEKHFPTMTRFGVMKHLKVLEDAFLVVTRKSGRFKYHYLNPVPIQDISDRWLSSFAKPWTTSMRCLKSELERPNTMSKPNHVYVTVIKTTPEKLWEALTNGAITPHYYYGATFKGTLEPGAEYGYVAPGGDEYFVRGTIKEVIPHKKIVATFSGAWMPGMEQDPPSQVTWEIKQSGDCCVLTLIHDGFDTETLTYQASGGGWPGILSGLKTYLETGSSLGYSPMANA